ncbi:PP2C family protein-serine/threonine phosphatase [Streptosporangium sandarakinum]|uniref:PP2C family protein-serine/threonine phosphatase n=1 Tax=Streptosporangium sandarakinum TaxID=1260955 RepID=UPI003680F5A8
MAGRIAPGRRLAAWKDAILKSVNERRLLLPGGPDVIETAPEAERAAAAGPAPRAERAAAAGPAPEAERAAAAGPVPDAGEAAAEPSGSREGAARRAEENWLTASLHELIMPASDEPRVLPGMRVAARYQPAVAEAYLGGDWYQAIPLDDGEVLLAVGDVAGHGLPAASAMAKLRHAITGLAFAGHDPAEILGVLNRMLCRLRPDVLATALVARYRPADRTLRWTHAGHPPMLLARSNRVERLLHPGVLLGVSEDATYTCGSVRLHPDDLLVMFTDGLIEKRGGDLYEGLDMLSRAVAGAIGPAPVASSPLPPALPSAVAALLPPVVPALGVAPTAPPFTPPVPRDRLTAVMDAMAPSNEADDTCVLIAQVTGAPA